MPRHLTWIALLILGLTLACSPARRGGGGKDDENNGLLNNGTSNNGGTNNGGANNGASCGREGFVLCGEACVDTSADPDHCGRCDQGCGTSGVCEAGECRTVEDCRQEGCAGLTVCDETTGRCVRGCTTNAQCGTEGAFCDGTTRTCACDAGSHVCDGACADDNDVATCGDRCEPCPTDPAGETTCVEGECLLTCAPDHLLCDGACAPCPTDSVDAVTCDGGACVASACVRGAHVCDGSCADDADVATCGDRCEPCPDDPRGSALCTRGTCDLDCDQGTLLCGTSCAVCPTTGVTHTICLEDRCIADRCEDGRLACDGACAPCPGGAAVAAVDCDGAACVATACAEGAVVCDDDCAPCPGGDAVLEVGCDGGECVATACGEGSMLCDGDCSACPTSAGIGALGCDAAGSCVATACEEGFLLCDTGCCEWNIETISSTAVYTLEAVSDDSGALHVAWDVGLGQGVDYALNTGDGWTIERVADNAETPSLALDPDDVPHIALSRDHVGPTPRVELATRVGVDTWTTELVTDLDDSNGNALVYDLGGSPHLVFSRSGAPTQYATVGIDGWVFEPIEGVFSFRFDIALDAQGSPWVCYRAAFDDVECADRGSAWATRRALGTYPDTFSLPVYRPSISTVFDDRTLLTAFTREGDGLVLASVSGQRVDIAPIDPGELAGLAVEVRVDRQRRRHLAWINHEQGLFYAVSSPDGWRIATVDAYVASPNLVALTLGPDDTPHIFYRHDGVRWATLR